MIFTENETNFAKLWGGTNESQYVKDAFHERIVQGRTDAVNPDGYGTKGSAWYNFQNVPPGGSAVVRFKLTSKIRHDGVVDEEVFDDVISKRKAEADAFYHHVSNLPISEDMRNIQRQAFAGMLWSKQYYHFIYKRWIEGDEKGPPPPPGRKGIRNRGWDHMYVDDILSMVLRFRLVLIFSPINGNIPSLLLGTLLSIVSLSQWSILNSLKSNLMFSPANGISTPMAKSQRTNGTFPMSTLLFMHGQFGALTTSNAKCMVAKIQNFSNVFSKSCC
jgi:hypothetical protein